MQHSGLADDIICAASDMPGEKLYIPSDDAIGTCLPSGR